MFDLVAFRAHVAVTVRGRRTEPGGLVFLPEQAPIVAILANGNAIERVPEFDDLALLEE